MLIFVKSVEFLFLNGMEISRVKIKEGIISGGINVVLAVNTRTANVAILEMGRTRRTRAQMATWQKEHGGEIGEAHLALALTQQIAIHSSKILLGRIGRRLWQWLRRSRLMLLIKLINR